MFTLGRDLTQPPHFTDDATPSSEDQDLPKDIMQLEAGDLALPGRGGSELAGCSDPVMFCF